MKFRVGLLASASLIGFWGVSTGQAADLPPPPPPPQYVEVVDARSSCFYLRADIGGSFHRRPVITKQGGGAFTSATNEKIKDHAFVEAGVGCQINKHVRVEATGGYRFRSSLTEAFGGLDAELETYTGFVNAFWDVVNYGGFTPYIGAGVGLAHHRLVNVKLPAVSADGNSTDFAYHVTAGVSYDLTDSVKMDLAYRYVDLGVSLSEGTNRLKVDKLRAHEVKLGVRYQFGDW